MSDQLKALLEELRAENSLKAWSVIITFFGDSISNRGGAVAAGTVQEVMAALNIGSGTVRTALSRLCKDGWVERTRSGRNSYYRLAERGATDFAEASARIYQAPPTICSETGSLYVVVFDPEKPFTEQTLPESVLLPEQNLLFAQINAATARDLQNTGHLICRIQNNALPEWVSRQLIPEHITQKYQRLSECVEVLLKHSIQSSLEALAIRTLLIHEWRRIRLRHKPLTISCTNAENADDFCHKQVALLYGQLTEPSEHWLDTKAQGPNGLLPVSDIVIDSRFR